MRKDFMLSEAEKKRRNRCAEENQTTTSQSTNLSSISQVPSNVESLSPIFTEIDQVNYFHGRILLFEYYFSDNDGHGKN